MPTGYTAAIKDGITFQQYAMTCARAFGALIEMRDDPMDAPIPDEFKSSDYHSKALATAKDKLASLKVLTKEAARIEADREFQESLNSYNRRLREKADLRSKYQSMLAEVEAWQAPTPDHAAYKAFMAEQITQSIEWDCSTKYDTPPECKSTDGWLSIAIAEAERSIAYHTDEHAKEVARAASRSAWVQALKKSLSA